MLVLDTLIRQEAAIEAYSCAYSGWPLHLYFLIHRHLLQPRRCLFEAVDDAVRQAACTEFAVFVMMPQHRSHSVPIHDLSWRDLGNRCVALWDQMVSRTLSTSLRTFLFMCAIRTDTANYDGTCRPERSLVQLSNWASCFVARERYCKLTHISVPYLGPNGLS